MNDFQMLENQPAAVIGILRELCKPQNMDLLAAVRDLGDSPDQSFMWHFSHVLVMDFDTYCFVEHAIDEQLLPALGIEQDYRDMSARYDEYLERVNANKRLNADQSERWEVLIKPFDDGWSGAYYGLLMRRVQYFVRKLFEN